MSNSLITIEKLNITTRAFLNEELNEITQHIYEIYQEVAGFANDRARQIAMLLTEVRDRKLYEQDGFESMADYAYEAFGMARSTAYKMASAGELYKDETIPAMLKENFTPTMLVELKSVTPSQLEQDIEKGILRPEMSQRELRNYAKSQEGEPESKVRKEKEYIVEYLLGYDRINLGDPMDMKSWDEYFTTMVTERLSDSEYDKNVVTTSLPSRSLDGTKSNSVKRKVYASSACCVLVEFKEVKKENESINKNSKKKSKKAKKGTTYSEEEITAKLERARGGEINSVDSYTDSDFVVMTEDKSNEQ